MSDSSASHIEVFLKEGVTDVRGRQVEAQALKFLGIRTGRVKSASVYSVRYALSDEQLARFAAEGLRDQVVHDVYVNRNLREAGYASYLLVGKLPGVTDDEGISAQKTLADLTNLPLDTSVQQIFTQDLYLFEERLRDEELSALGVQLLGNPLINRFSMGQASSRSYSIPDVRLETESTFETVDIFVTDEELLHISRERVLSLSLDEMRAIQEHYRDPGVLEMRREMGLPPLPTDCELEVLAQTWSEHCKHKEFNAEIRYRDLDTGEERVIDSLFKTYIRRSTETVMHRLEEYGNNWLITVFNDNAGVVRIDDRRVFVWKVETHNTPSALDPYGGAITGILGNNRDPLGTGRGGGRLLFNTNVLCFGPPDYDRPLLTGQLHPLRVFSGVRHGIEDGGNKSGVPTVNGSIVFDDRYAGKPLVYCGTGSVMPASYSGRDSWEKEIRYGDCIVMGGGRVGKDGIHGATFSSTEIDKHSPKSAVQIGSPITQKLLSDFLERACEQGLVRCTTDNGAGGLSSSVGELALLSGGAVVHLEKVPLKYSGLKPWEIFVSESQERMTLVVDPDKMNELFEMAARFEVELTHIGQFTSTRVLDVRYDGRPVAYLDIGFLHDGLPRKRMTAEWKAPDLSEPVLPPIEDYGELLLALCGSLNICSREDVIRQYDHEVKGKTVVKPLMGLRGVAPQDAAVMRLDFDSYRGLAISNGIVPRYGDIDAYEMSAGAFDEAVRQIISVGGRLPDPSRPGNGFWTVNDNFCVPDSQYNAETNPDGRYKLAQLVRMCEALYDMAVFFNVPMTSGKDSMKNDFNADGVKISVPPTLLYSMVAMLDDVRRTVTSEFKAPGDLIYQLGTTYDELGASEFYRLFRVLGANVPRVRKEDARELYLRVADANELGLLESSHDLSDGGLAVALAESAFGAGLGADVELIGQDPGLNALLFSESHSRFVVTIRPENRGRFDALMQGCCEFLGEVSSTDRLVINHAGRTVIDLELQKIVDAWSNGLRLP